MRAHVWVERLHGLLPARASSGVFLRDQQARIPIRIAAREGGRRRVGERRPVHGNSQA
jgi:hypothetical protein